MARATATKEHRCERCGQVFTSPMRLQHHQAADHAPRTMRDIRTTSGIRHSTGKGGSHEGRY
ncbi:MAG: hypothetical protein Q8O76_00270 [Chloroflexota bacterium]|nr:hypothetical protein [Chloroflexota bacterium]